MDPSSIHCASVVYKDYEDKVWVECGQKGEEKDTQASPLADLQEVSVGHQSPLVTPQRVFVGHQSPLETSQGVFVGLQSAHATSQGVFVVHQSAHATLQGGGVCHQSAHATLQRVIGCIKCAPAIFFALFGRCFSVGLSTVARQTNPNRFCRRAGVAF